MNYEQLKQQLKDTLFCKPMLLVVGAIVLLTLVTCVSAKVADVQTQQQRPEIYNPFPVQAFMLETEDKSRLECQPLDPRGIYICRFLPPQ